jgi:hypothetical protein
VGPRAGLNAEELSVAPVKDRTPVTQSVATHYPATQLIKTSHKVPKIITVKLSIRVSKYFPSVVITYFATATTELHILSLLLCFNKEKYILRNMCACMYV